MGVLPKIAEEMFLQDGGIATQLKKRSLQFGVNIAGAAEYERRSVAAQVGVPGTGVKFVDEFRPTTNCFGLDAKRFVWHFGYSHAGDFFSGSMPKSLIAF